MTNEQLAKLPKWAQREFSKMESIIETLKNQRDLFVSQDQTSMIYIEPGLREPVRRYINSDHVYIENLYTKLEVMAHENELRLYWAVTKRKSFDEVVTFIPQASNCAHMIKTKRVYND